MKTKQFARAWWYRLLVGLLAVFSWFVAVAAFAQRFDGLRSSTAQFDWLAVVGWALGLCAVVLVSDLLSSAESSDLHRDA
jgi:hypothetical protein